MNKIDSYIKENNVLCLYNEPLKNHTTFKIGGACPRYIEVTNTKDLICILDAIKNENEDYYIIGNGSNLLVDDNGINKNVIRLSSGGNITVDDNGIISVFAGVMMSRLSNFAMQNELGGLEFAQGIPGSVGGGVYMNCGAYGGEIGPIIKSVEYIDDNLEIKEIENKDLEFGYRYSFFRDKPYIITQVKFKLEKRNKEEIKADMDEFSKRRKEKQPLSMPSAGSVFKRPEGYFAGKLIQDCGLKGYKIGGAMVSNLHSGFIVNDGGATCADVLNLISHIKTCVFEKFGVQLETEVKYIK